MGMTTGTGRAVSQLGPLTLRDWLATMNFEYLSHWPPPLEQCRTRPDRRAGSLQPIYQPSAKPEKRMKRRAAMATQIRLRGAAHINLYTKAVVCPWLITMYRTYTAGAVGQARDSPSEDIPWTTPTTSGSDSRALPMPKKNVGPRAFCPDVTWTPE
ncbi:hypothetical protein PGTUg99_009425 [Puccinia graminis f. sp. tritici]|uniref:Uncharacterized protein n=1 Tax=Puccinia graminis f. sp. tritici TaxID=56615 RepID=A0A5B0RD58_PUCGR|nr:hypothetical protein PGTUg99_009425 [Puccinia graminis f. sp. tritici]